MEGVNELYDLSTDPREERNLINDPGHRDVVRQMQAEQKKLLQETRGRAI